MALSTKHPLFTKANVIVAALIILLVVSSFAVLFAKMAAPTGPSEGYTALVHDSEGAIHRLPLGIDEQVRIETDAGTNVVEVQDGRVFMAQSDCDGQDCLHQGSLDEPGQQIICLPHKLWVEVVAEEDSEGQMDVGAVAQGDSASDPQSQWDSISR